MCLIVVQFGMDRHVNSIWAADYLDVSKLLRAHLSSIYQQEFMETFC